MPKKAKLKTKNEKLKTTTQKPKAASKKQKSSSELTVPVINFGGKNSKTTVPSEIFGVKVKPETLAQAVRVYLTNQRLGTVKTKTRGEVRGGGRKPWRQKGTGRARAGSIRAPHWRGGGVVFGPSPRVFFAKLPKKVRKLALFGALSAKLAAGNVKIFNNFEKMAPKTKELAKVLGSSGLLKDQTVLVIDGSSQNLVRAGKNLPKLSFCRVENLTAYQILKAQNLIFTKVAIEKLTLRQAQDKTKE